MTQAGPDRAGRALGGAAGPARGGRGRRVAGVVDARVGEREVLLSLAATPGPLPAAVATRLAEGRDPRACSVRTAPSRRRGRATRRPRPAAPGPRRRGLAAGRHTARPTVRLAVRRRAGPAPAMASVAVVGGRRASPLRRAAARSIGAGLARAGWCVVSGGAVGVDAAAHAGAVDAGGRTVVVLGCGLDVPYPRANTGLFARVLAGGGTLTSEHPPGSPAPGGQLPPPQPPDRRPVRRRGRGRGRRGLGQPLHGPGRRQPRRRATSSSSREPPGTRAPPAATSSSATAPPWSAASPTSSRSSAPP